MGKIKTIKDPIYNYIELDEIFIPLINTPEFQRLRNIRQTGYEALYPSALHNRFVHSLGVFHLGVKAITFFKKNIQGIIPECLNKQWDAIEQTFLCACLLHDVGHSPFSHTGENYYTKGINFEDEIHTALQETQTTSSTSDTQAQSTGQPETQLTLDIRMNEDGTGKPHEAMSALIGLELCDKLGITINKDLFVRSIIGVKYNIKNCNTATSIVDEESAPVLNAIIGLLNGKLIDVDKLDYTIRDSYVTGYNSITIDLERLLSGYTLYKKDQTLMVGYKKGALSVIENVIYANDLERRWIQNHPSVLYDCFLVDTLLGHYDSFMKGDQKIPTVPTVFTRASLSFNGMGGLRQPLKLLNDSDIIAYIKNYDESNVGKQYLSRGERLKPLWKTEAAFTPLSKDFGQDLMNAIQKDFKTFLDINSQRTDEPFINENTEKFISERIREAQDQYSAIPPDLNRAKHIFEIFKTFKNENELPDFQFVLILSGRFKTNYRKIDTESVMIQLETEYVPLHEIMSLQARETNSHQDKTFFYVYTTNNNVKGQENLGQKFFDCLRRNYKRG